jgi:hypothetical protein
MMYMPEELTETTLSPKVVRIPKGMVVFSGREWCWCGVNE